MEDCFEISRKDESWFLVSDFKSERLYTKKEVARLVKNGNFLEKSIELREEGIFDASYFIDNNFVRNKSAAPLKNKRELWTQKGVDYLKKIYLLDKKDTEKMTELYFFVSDAIGENQLAKLLTLKHNNKFPENPWTETATKAFFSTQWGDLTAKTKNKFLQCTNYLQEIKRDIEANNLSSIFNPDYTLDFSEYQNMHF